ncbi:hypothetical protein BpHYR1_042995 [Brachionus plicatilis]|uniref:Uncharacterized protein n=1 Tax=Brachionus plicatilis TaxID=10195 RepID=A0A3M7SM73_BRAPC|nr:hypothetical protein BpHYR1_042995 [Brachionus plicatilis]
MDSIECYCTQKIYLIDLNFSNLIHEKDLIKTIFLPGPNFKRFFWDPVHDLGSKSSGPCISDNLSIRKAIKLFIILNLPFETLLLWSVGIDAWPFFSVTISVGYGQDKPVHYRDGYFRPFDRSARGSNFWTAKINGLKYTDVTTRKKTVFLTVQKLDCLADRPNDRSFKGCPATADTVTVSENCGRLSVRLYGSQHYSQYRSFDIKKRSFLSVTIFSKFNSLQNDVFIKPSDNSVQKL